jgi:hypothetical protein
MRRICGIDAVRQGEVDDPELAAEMDRRFGAAIRQFVQPAATPAGKYQGNRLARQLESFSIHHFATPCEIDPSHLAALVLSIRRCLTDPS